MEFELLLKLIILQYYFFILSEYTKTLRKLIFKHNFVLKEPIRLLHNFMYIFITILANEIFSWAFTV